jgi:hypothetical protein
MAGGDDRFKLAGSAHAIHVKVVMHLPDANAIGACLSSHSVMLKKGFA